jgi:hypothetical protein
MHALWIATALVLAAAPPDDDPKIKLADCPAAVRKTLQAEAKGAKIDHVTREKEGDEEAIYWAEVAIAGKPYSIGVLEDGTLAEMNLAVDDAEVPLEKCPGTVQATLFGEAFGEKITSVGKDRKYGVTVYEAVVDHKGRTYEIVVAEDGTLVEKVLVIDDEEVELEACPAAVKAAFKAHADGGTIRDVTRSTGIGQPTYEAEVEIQGKVYLIEVAESGLLLSKSLDAAAD